MKITPELLRASLRSWVASDMQRVGPWWLQLVWTQLFCMIVAVGFTVLGFALFASGSGAWRNLSGWAYWYGQNLIVSMTVGFTVHGLFEVSARLIGAQRLRTLSNPLRTLYFAGIPMLGVAIGWPLGASFVMGRSWVNLDNPNAVAASILLSLLITFIFYIYFDAKARQIMAEKRATEAQLRLLQGQMEPHFLFNTLANVLALMDHDTPRARGMLEAFVDYLRATLATMRRDEHALGVELDLAAAYLRVLQSRMDERLRFRIEADDAARAVPMPPLLLQPLVENAVTHGLEAKVEGGEVLIQARLEGEALVLDVRDDGLGLDAPRRSPQRSGHGMALQNIRERLQTLYGGGASLELQPQITGTLVRLRLPLPA